MRLIIHDDGEVRGEWSRRGEEGARQENREGGVIDGSWGLPIGECSRAVV